MLYYNSSVEETLDQLETSRDGLSNSDAVERIKNYGHNSLTVHGESLWHKIIEPFASVFMLVLFIAATISAFHKDYIDALIILVIISISATIYYVQRLSTAKILKALKKHDTLLVRVNRDGVHLSIIAEDIVPGDIVYLSEGDKIPADVRLIEGENVRVNEASLTGESNPINKKPEKLIGKKEIYEQTNVLFQGSFIVSGEATGVVLGTGNATEFGRLASLSATGDTESPVQLQINKLLTQIVVVVACIAVVAFILALYRGTQLNEAIEFVMAVSVSAVPESLPVAISIILVLGMRRMALKNALVRDVRAIETVGVLTTIATDKTGTLTKNELSVQEYWQFDKNDKAMTQAISLTVNNKQGEKNHDPLDLALNNYLGIHHYKIGRYDHVASFPFDQSKMMSGNLWKLNSNWLLCVKGSPESILDRSILTEYEREEAVIALHKLTSLGYRVIGLASTELDKKITSLSLLKSKERLTFIGYVAVADVLRPEARPAISAALQAGVTVRMITGDHFETAFHIGKKLGIVKNRSEVFDSRRMYLLGDDELNEVIAETKVFSRVVPENKFRILSLLKETNVAAMTGDGVNDVPALTNAHVGVAMGSGSEIAKDAGDIILLDNNFKSIIGAMHEGRIVLSNIRRMLFYLLSTNAGEALTAIGALAIGLPIPLLPVQILWVNLVTDTLMVIPLGLEPGDKDIMKRKPLPLNAPILRKQTVIRIGLVSVTMTVVALFLYSFYYHSYGEQYARTIVFCSLVVMQWANAFNARSDHHSIIHSLIKWNGKFYAGLIVAVSLQGLAVFGPLQSLLHVKTIPVGDLVITGTISVLIPIIVVEIHKFFTRRSIR